MSAVARAVGIEVLEIKDILILTSVQMYFIFLMGCTSRKKGKK